MYKRQTFKVFFSVLIAVFFISGATVSSGEVNKYTENLSNSTQGNSPITIFFVGDIMLGRVVENIIERNGFDYIFSNTRDLIQNADLSVGNFEGTVTKNHIQTPPFAFQFSIKDRYLELLSGIGFDTLSLANNHSYDFGQQSLNYTRSLCDEYDLFCVGDPNQINLYSTGLQEVNGLTVGYLFLHTLVSMPDEKKITESIKNLKSESDFIVVYIHWGIEYELKHNQTQEDIAHLLIDSGADTVIGHHPHVVQDIEIYKNKPIFYSLGNFIFDQYFDSDVQEGLGINLIIDESDVAYEIIGFSSTESHSQPRKMNTLEEEKLFSRILNSIKHSNGQLVLYPEKNILACMF